MWSHCSLIYSELYVRILIYQLSQPPTYSSIWRELDQKLKKLFQYLHLMILQFARYKFFKCFSINDAAIFMDRFPVLHYNSATLHSEPRMSIKNENVYFWSLWLWWQGGFLSWVINSITCHQSSPSQASEVIITCSERVFLLQCMFGTNQHLELNQTTTLNNYLDIFLTHCINKTCKAPIIYGWNYIHVLPVQNMYCTANTCSKHVFGEYTSKQHTFLQRWAKSI